MTAKPPIPLDEEDKTTLKYEELLTEVARRRGNRSIDALARRFYKSWRMSFDGTRQHIRAHLESGPAWERLTIGTNGKMKDKLNPNMTNLQARCSRMKDYLPAIGYTQTEVTSFFRELSELNPLFSPFV